MHRLKIQRVRRVPPIPTTIIVIPNVQLSMLDYLLIMLRDHGPEKNNLIFHRPKLSKRLTRGRGPPERRHPLKAGKQGRKTAPQLKERFNPIERVRRDSQIEP